MTRPAPHPANEDARLARLKSLNVLDSEAEPLFDALTRAAALVAGVPIAMVTLVDADRQWFKANHGLPGATQTPRDEAFCAYTILSDQVFEVQDATKDHRFDANPLVTGSPDIRFYAGAPIILSDGLGMGALCVIDREARQLTPAQREILQLLARAAAEALDQRALAVDRSQALREEANVERANQDRIRYLYEETPAMLYSVDADDRLLSVSNRWLRRLGYTRGQVLGRRSAEFFTDASRERAARGLAELFATGRCDRVDYQMLRSNGEVIDVELSATVERGVGGKPIRSMSVIEDVTERRRAEARLRSSEAFLDRTGRMAGVGGWEVDLATSRITWSAQTCRLHEMPVGYEPGMEEALAFYAPEAREVIKDALALTVEEGGEWDLELPFITATGRKLWVRSMGAVEHVDGRPARLVGAFQDITMRKQAVLAMEASELRFRNLFQQSLGLICTHDVDGVLLSVNQATARSLGYGVADMMGRRIHDFVRPELHGGLEEYLARVLINGSDAGMFELLASDGSAHVWQYNNMLDDDGAEPYVIGHAQDITERRRLERSLRESATRDPLTGCYNRRYLADLETAMRDDDRWGCIAIDLDRFKLVNDTYGHQRGDAVLVDMARYLMAHVRPGDAVVRLGGDEFLVMLRNADPAVTQAIADRLVADRAQAPIGFTLGISLREAGVSLAEAIGQADRKLYDLRALRDGVERLDRRQAR
jgi:diguanylate cyclase (GGDEF)-like protein/PAS domain S-box-containing protein